MGLIINTFYFNKDIFLRELISNASDALDKSATKALLTQRNSRPRANSNITPDKSNNTITLQDTGVGMTK